MNCPFYGRRLVQLTGEPAFLLFRSSGGNQCALCTASHSPCYLELECGAVDWRACERVRVITDDVDRDVCTLRAGVQ